MNYNFIEIEKTDGDKVIISVQHISLVGEHTLANGAFGWTYILTSNREIHTYESYEKIKDLIEKAVRYG